MRDFENPFENSVEPQSEDLKKVAAEKIMNTDSLLDQIEALTTLVEDCKLSDEFFAQWGDCIKKVADRFSLTPMQTVLQMPYIGSPDECLSQRDLSRFFKCPATRLFKVSADLTTLVRRRYLSRQHRFHGDSLAMSDFAKKSFEKEQVLPVSNINGLSPKEFMKEFRGILEECLCSNNITCDDLLEETDLIVKENPQLKIVQVLKDYHLTDVKNDENMLIVLYFCKRLVCDFQGDISLEQLSRLFDDFYIHGRAFQRGNHELVKMGILEPSGETMQIKEMFRLSNEAREKFLSEFDEIIEAKNQEEGNTNLFRIVKADGVKAKSLFYSPSNQKEIDILSDLLTVEHFNGIRKNLLDNNMRPGFNCLFYGAPGTGKTETVLQLARATGRDVMSVDISAIRDKWYGDTEKHAREIFEAYAALVKKRDITPILLFNEADALLSVRTSVGNGHSTDKTENAIQNIFLEGMENLDGIMVATTNLSENLDPAFERRFIYKVKFEKPSLEAKTSIWKSLMPALSDADAHTLAAQFDFSGGQIENIARKSFVEQLLFSKEPSLERLIELCSQEKLENAAPRRAMGFGASKAA